MPAADALFVAHQNRIRRYLARMTGRGDAARDLTPGEALVFNLPALDDDGLLAGHRFSLYLRPAAVKPSSEQEPRSR